MIYIYLFSFFPSLFIALYFIFAHESRMTNNLLDLVYCYRGSCCFFFVLLLTYTLLLFIFWHLFTHLIWKRQHKKKKMYKLSYWHSTTRVHKCFSLRLRDWKQLLLSMYGIS